MKRSFIGDTVTRRKSEDGFRENYVQAIYIIDNMSHAIGDVFIKVLYGIHNEQFKRSGFYELAKKSEKVEPVTYFKN